jgi:hypothetical protein
MRWKICVVCFMAVIAISQELGNATDAASLASKAFAEPRLPKVYNFYRFECSTSVGNSRGSVRWDRNAVKVEIELGEKDQSARVSQVIVSDKEKCLADFPSSRIIKLYPRPLRESEYFRDHRYAVLPDHGWNLMVGRKISDFLTSQPPIPKASRESYDTSHSDLLIYKRFVASGECLEISFDRARGVPLSYREINADGTKGLLEGEYQWTIAENGEPMLVSLKEKERGVDVRFLRILDGKASDESISTVKQYLDAAPIGYKIESVSGRKVEYVGGLNGRITRKLLGLADEVRSSR